MLETAIAGAVAPLLVATTLLVLVLILLSRGQEWGAPPLAASAVAFGYVAGHVAIIGTPPWPPAGAQAWGFVVALAAIPLAAADVAVSRPLYSWLQRGAFGLFFAMAMLAPLARHSWSAVETIAGTLALTAAFVLVHASAESLRARVQPSALAAVLAGSSGGLAVALVLGGTALFGQLVGALAFALTPVFFMAWGGRASRWIAGVTLPAVAMGVFFLAAGTFFAEVPRSAALAWIASVPLAALAAKLLERRAAPWLSWVVVNVVALIPVVIAIALALASRSTMPAEYGG